MVGIGIQTSVGHESESLACFDPLFVRFRASVLTAHAVLNSAGSEYAGTEQVPSS